ncbi:hypothetical protein M902_0588 [Bacteriovorax sp. BAL6_X]|nr:hypothetical protein M902_0588 [Bacteriovorax sp. BAL6_X]
MSCFGRMSFLFFLFSFMGSNLTPWAYLRLYFSFAKVIQIIFCEMT